MTCLDRQAHPHRTRRQESAGTRTSGESQVSTAGFCKPPEPLLPEFQEGSDNPFVEFEWNIGQDEANRLLRCGEWEKALAH